MCKTGKKKFNELFGSTKDKKKKISCGLTLAGKEKKKE